MVELIKEKLGKTAKEENVRILYSCESGSRAWGFASPDSDYDVRLICSHNVNWYLSLNEGRDTIQEIDDETTIDLSGWELRKALKLFASCNPGFNEWLGSPIVYAKEPEFIDRLRALIPNYFNPKKAMFHYLSLAKNIAREHLDGDRITIKKAFYIIRPLAAASWIRDQESMPPTYFLNLLEGSVCPDLKLIRSDIVELE